MLGGLIIATVLFRKRSAVIVCAIVTIVTPFSLLVLFPNANQLTLFISISAVTCLSVLVFQAINDAFEKNRRRKLEGFNITLIAQNEELKKINDELDRFVYGVSHDMRAPLSSVKELVNLYKTESKSEIKDSYIHHIESSISKLDNYTSDIVDFAKNSRTETRPVRINIKEYLNSI
jgi:signal transduction histidine kinase